MKIVYKNYSLKQFLYQYFKLLNTAQKNEDSHLTFKEIETLTEFLILPPKFKDKRFGMLARNKVIEALSTPKFEVTRQNLNNRIYSILEKGYLWRDEDTVIYPKPYITKAIEIFKKASSNFKDFIVEFKFTFDVPERSGTDIQTDSTSDKPTAKDS